MFCSECGFDNGEGVNFCMRCGTKLVKEETVAPKEEDTKEEVQETVEPKEEVIKEEVQETVEPKEEVIKEEVQEAVEPKEEVIKEEVRETVEPKEEVIKEEVQQAVEPKEEEMKAASQESVATPSVPTKPVAKQKKGGKAVAIAGCTLAALAVAGGGGYYVYHINTPQYKYDKCISQAEKLVDEEDYKAAIDKYLEANGIQKLEDGEKKDIYKVYIILAKNCVEEKEYEEALANFEAARAYAKTEAEVDEEAAELYLILARNAAEKKDGKTALGYLEKAEEYVKDEEELNSVRFDTYSALGEKATEEKKFDEAEKYLDQARIYCTDIILSNNYYINLYVARGEEELANERYQYSLSYYDKATQYGWDGEERKHKYCETVLAYAKNRLDEGYPDEAISFLSTVNYYAVTDDEKKQAEELTTLANEALRQQQISNSPYPIYTDENGNIYDLGGMEIVIRDWWSGDYPAEPTNAYEEARQEYREWIQETYNFTIKEQAISDWGSVPADFVSYVTSGGDDNNYVFTLHEDASNVSSMRNGLMYDLSTLDCLDFTEAKFSDNKVHELYTWNGKIYAMDAGEADIRRGGLYFNKRILAEAGIDPDYIYELQRNNEWTWDKWIEIMEEVQKDTDNDGVIDVFGTTQNNYNLVNSSVWSNGGEYVGKVNDKYVYRLEDTETLEGLEFAVDVLNNYTYPYPEGANWDYYQQVFLNAEAAFLVDDGYVVSSYLRDMEDDFGFVCFPRGPRESQYVTCWNDNPIVIPACYDEDRAWAIAFAWNLYTNPVAGFEDYSVWTNAYRDYVRDTETITETWKIMSENGKISYDGMIPNLYRESDFTWNFTQDVDLSDLIGNVRKNWKAYIDEANN